MTAIFLDRFANLLGEPLHKVFDLIIGNSTGGVLALGIAKGLSPEVIVDMYRNRGADMFKPRWPRMAWWRRERYSHLPLENELKKVLGLDVIMSSAVTNVMVLSYDIWERKSHHFTSYGINKNELMWRAARATSAAPGFFEPLDGRYIDGGLMQNNPIIKGLAQAAKLYPDFPVRVMSVGTGEATRSLKHEDIKGLAKLAPKMAELFMDGQTDAAYEDAFDLTDGNVFRFEHDLSRFQQQLHLANDDFDDVSPNNFLNLELEANLMWDKYATALIELARRIKEERT